MFFANILSIDKKNSVALSQPNSICTLYFRMLLAAKIPICIELGSGRSRKEMANDPYANQARQKVQSYDMVTTLALEPNIPAIISNAAETVGALKNTQAKCTNTKVRNQPANFGMGRHRHLRQTWHSEIAAPCIAPQTINVHPAPCHMPPMRKVKNTLRAVLGNEHLLPPNEKYR